MHLFNGKNVKRCCKASFTLSCFISNSTEQAHHIPVMVKEVTEHLQLKNGNTILDMTFGGGGHSRSILDKYENIRILALDRDPLAYKISKQLQKERPTQILPLLGRFSDLPKLFKKMGIPYQSLDGVICDAGVSSLQTDMPERGFTVSGGPLDMRMDGDRIQNQITAADVLNYASEDELYKIFKIYGQDRYSRLIARSIVQARFTYKKFKTTSDLNDLIQLVCGKAAENKSGNISYSTAKIFQALRFFVNNELNELNYGLMLANLYLKSGSRIVVLTGNSIQDVIVKRHFEGHIIDNIPGKVPGKYKLMSACIDQEIEDYVEKPWAPINAHVIVPQREEIEQNPRCQTVKLRAAVKLRNVKQFITF